MDHPVFSSPQRLSRRLAMSIAAGFLLLLQGLVEIVRCVICLQTGEWPSREQDVEEVDVDKLKQMVQVKDSDIEALDQYVNRKGGAA